MYIYILLHIKNITSYTFVASFKKSLKDFSLSLKQNCFKLFLFGFLMRFTLKLRSLYASALLQSSLEKLSQTISNFHEVCLIR